ncbi:hypothetical protein ACFFJN_02975 [Erwinia mallotivora]|uniref:hypothetical protein n=1 Tax=Erwinia mallotivora TaxID=69222 RepID=UPI0035EFC6B0
MAVASPGLKSASGQKVAALKKQQEKTAVTDCLHREKPSSPSGCTPDEVVVENNYLSDKDIKTFTEKYAAAKTETEKDQLLADLKKQDAEKQRQALSTGISIDDQKDALTDLKALAASPECIAQCQELAAYSISELAPFTNNGVWGAAEQ